MATSSNEPIRLPLVSGPENRSTSEVQDARLVNCYVEKDGQGELWVAKRPGFFMTASIGIGRGIYYWTPVNNTAAWGLLSVVDGTLTYSLSGGGTTTYAVDSTSGSVYWFNATLGTPSYAYISNGVKGYTINSAGTFNAITDINYPAATVPGSAYLDGTLYVMDSQARIWGTSGLNNPTAWSALNLIQAQVEPDAGVAIAKQAIYVVALKQFTTEFFYDSGSPTGSPLLPVQNAKIGVGCADGLSVQSVDDTLFWVAQEKAGGRFVVMLSGLKYKRISTPYEDRILTNYVGNLIGMIVRIQGHTFYQIFTPNATYPYMIYDMTVGIWSYWANTLQVAFSSGAASPQFIGQPASTVYMATDGSTGTIPSNTNRLNDVKTGGTPVTAAISAEIVTPNFDAGTGHRKTLSKMRIMADQANAGALEFRWSDNDYVSWTPWRAVNLNMPYPAVTNLGTFRRRAFNFRHTSPAVFRMKACELSLLLGSS